MTCGLPSGLPTLSCFFTRGGLTFSDRSKIFWLPRIPISVNFWFWTNTSYHGAGGYQSTNLVNSIFQNLACNTHSLQAMLKVSIVAGDYPGGIGWVRVTFVLSPVILLYFTCLPHFSARRDLLTVQARPVFFVNIPYLPAGPDFMSLASLL